MLTDIASHLTETFVDEWTGCPIIYDNQPPVDMSEEQTWARFVIRFGDQKIRTIGERKNVDQMLRVYLQIFTKRGEGSGDALNEAGKFAVMFDHYRHHEEAFTLHGQDHSISTLDDDPDWYQVNISVFMIASYKI